MTDALQVLQDADFGWVQSLESVWSLDDTTGAGPNGAAVEAIVGDLVGPKRPSDPPGRVLLGQAGIGKTHLVGVLRRRAWARDGWFVLLDVIGITDFWKSAALSFVTSLLQEMPDGQRQYEAVIAGIARQFRIEREVKIAFDSPEIEPKKIVDLLVGGLLRKDPANALRHQDVFRAISLLRSRDLSTVSVAHAWLQGYDADEALRRGLGFLTPPPAPVDIVRGLLWVMGLAGPTLIAVDQIDGVISASHASAQTELSDGTNFTELLGGGLLDLARVINRGLLVITCLLSSWEIIRTRNPASFQQSFPGPIPLSVARDGDFVRELIAERLAPAYAKAGIVPSSPTYPFTGAAVRSAAAGMTPRTILMRCDEHRRLCLAEGEVRPCDTLAEPVTHGRSDAGDGAVHALDDAFSLLARGADLDGLLDERDDGRLGLLLRDAFDLYAKQIPPHDDYDVVSRADPAQRTPPLHGRLTFIDHLRGDRERHFCFRALQHANATALCSRFRAALTASGIAAGIEHRSLIVVRRGPPPSGATTKKLFDGFFAAGGLLIDPSDADLRGFVALRDMRDRALADSRFDAFERWLIERRPLCDTAFFEAAGLCPPPIPDAPPRRAPADGSGPAASLIVPEGAKGGEPPIRRVDDGLAPRVGLPEPKPVSHADPEPRDAPSRVGSIPVGRRRGGDAAEAEVSLATDLLRRHTAIIAGAGSGKTVLLRRIVEEAALAGIPAVVVDPNNDLSRLGEPWPERPPCFTAGDDAKAARYFSDVEVVVWTPGIRAGNPLSLSVLPDFAAVGDDPDEREQLIGMAAEALGPLAKAKPPGTAAGVLSDALRHFARRGGGLQALIALLADLPDSVSDIGRAEQVAGKLADELRASVSTNPLLKADGPALDPKLLLFGPDPARTRVSVVNLSGLPSASARQDFVNRLQMALFGWIKRHPSPRGMLYVIDEAQDFIPSAGPALSKSSGVQLVSQARKYGLGMAVATQAPKGIDNRVVSNCSTQFLGKQNAPATIAAARELIAAAGGTADDMGKLSTGEFYFKTEKSGKPFKLTTPICLSHHPANPPTPEEVVARARACRSLADTR